MYIYTKLSSSQLVNISSIESKARFWYADQQYPGSDAPEMFDFQVTSCVAATEFELSVQLHFVSLSYTHAHTVTHTQVHLHTFYDCCTHQSQSMLRKYMTSTNGSWILSKTFLCSSVRFVCFCICVCRCVCSCLGLVLDLVHVDWYAILALMCLKARIEQIWECLRTPWSMQQKFFGASPFVQANFFPRARLWLWSPAFPSCCFVFLTQQWGRSQPMPSIALLFSRTLPALLPRCQLPRCDYRVKQNQPNLNCQDK